MSLGSGFDSPQQSTSNVWSGGSPGGGSFGTGGFDYGQTGLAQPAYQNEVTVGKNSSGGSAAQAAVTNQATPNAKSPPPYYPSRDELLRDIQKDPSKFNVPPNMPPDQFAQQYFNEFVAKLAGKQPFPTDAKGNQVSPDPNDPKQKEQVWTKDEKDMLRKWGYNPDVPKGNIVDDNSNSGLYGLRIEPLNGSMPPIVAFRGTEPTAGPQDLQSDLGGKYVGQSQYEGNAAQINQRLSRPGDQNVNVVGYSLGGALAQKYAVEHAQQTGQLTTFQAPGISQTDADRFKAANADGHVAVNHFYNDADIVHRAGEAKLDGSFHQVVNPKWQVGKAGLAPHLSSIICNSNSDFEGTVGQNNIHTYAKDQQGDRAKWEGARRLLGPAASTMIGGGFGIKDGIVDGVKGIGEIGNGFGDLLHDPLKGAGEIGHGAWDMVKGAGEGVMGLGQLGLGALQGAGALLSKPIEVGVDAMKRQWQGAKMLGAAMMPALSSVGHSIYNGASNMVHSAGQGIANAGHAVYDGASNLVHSAGQGISNAGSAIYNGASNVVSGAGKAVSNGVSSLKKLVHWPW